MKIDGDYTFDAPRDLVWEALQDPVVLASVMPGCEMLDLVGDNAYEGALNIKVGPVQGKFQGKINLEEIVEPEGYTMQVDGRGASGFVKATAKIRLEEEGGKTRLVYDSDSQVGGRIASVGQRLLDSSAKAIIKQSLDGLNKVMQARSEAVAQGGEASDAEIPEIQAPSQAAFATGVAKEVAKDLVPKPVLIGAGIVLLLLILWLLLRSF